MNKRIATSLILGVIGLVIFTLLAVEQVMAGQAAVPAQAANSPSNLLGVNTVLGTGFTYQGVLKDSGGNPLNSTCNFTFRLWDAESGGVKFGTDSLATGVSVVDGYFTASVNAGGEFGVSAFIGQARWLEVSVQCTGDAAVTTLSPRQALTAAPYALYAQSVGTHSHWGASWGGSGTGLTLSGGQIGLFSSGSAVGVYGISGSTTGVGVYGQGVMTGTVGIFGTAHSTSGTAGYFINTSGSGVWGRGWGVRAITGSGSPDNLHPSGNFYPAAGEFAGPNGVIGAASSDANDGFGVAGVSTGASGRGVYGYASNTAGYNYGVFGWSLSSSGIGVYGSANASTGYTNGVYGQSNSTNGSGLYGYASASTGATYGVYGQSNSTSGNGLYGYAEAATGATFGVYGQSNSNSGTGVFGITSATTGNTYGVYGQSESTSGKGVYGYTSAASGYTYGVYGESISTEGRGVYGYTNATTGVTYGVYGYSTSTAGYGVYGLSDLNGAYITAGVYGRSDADDGFGVVGHNYYAGVGVGAWSYTGNLIEAYGGDYPSGTLRFYIDQSGNVYADGTYSSPANSLDGTTRALTAIQSTEVWMEDYGRASLMDGKAVVSIAPDFAGVANLSVDYLVFVTLEGDCQGVYITNKTPTSFEVHEVNDGKSNVTFVYRIVAKQPGSENVRLPEVTIPEPAEVTRQPDEGVQPPVAPQPAVQPQPANSGQTGQEQQP
jgi:hypothetical protein